jgi:O-antigen/teichoic acid export membrane protein
MRRISADAEVPPPLESDSIARNAAFTFAGHLTSAAFTTALTLYLVRALGPTGYGVFALSFAISALLILPSDFGVSASAMRLIAEHRGDRLEIARIMADAVRLKLLASSVVSLALLATAGPIADAYGEPALVWPLRGVAIALFGHSLTLLFLGAFVAQGKASRNFGIILSESAAETAASITLVVLGAGATGAAFGRAIGYAVGAGVGLALVARFFRGTGAARHGSRRTREIAHYAGALSIVEWIYTLFTQLNAILIGAFLSSAAVGAFQAPARLFGFFAYPGLAIADGVSPRIAHHQRHGQEVGAFSSALRLLILLQAAFVAPLVVWPTPIASLLFGADYSESADVLRAMAPYVFLLGPGILLSAGANYLGAARRRVPIAVATLLVNLLIGVLLIPRIGIVAAAIGADIAYAIYALAHLRLCAGLMKIPLVPVLGSVLRAALAALAMGGVLFLVGTSELSLADWLLGSVGGGVAYLATLVAAREVRPAELLDVSRALRRSSRLRVRAS